MAEFLFDGKSFPVLPETLLVRQERNLIRTKLAGGGEQGEDLGFGPREVEGKGVMAYTDFSQQQESLRNLLLTSDPKTLTLPGGESFPAWCVKLEIAGKAAPDRLEFTFWFVERQGG